VQIAVIPIADRHLDYAQQVASELRGEGLRVELDERSERMNLKIREAQLAKIPYMLIAGDAEVQDSTVSVRLRSGENLRGQSLAEFKDRVRAAIMSKREL
jgi:threonyl-tRNA synthetase